MYMYVYFQGIDHDVCEPFRDENAHELDVERNDAVCLGWSSWGTLFDTGAESNYGCTARRDFQATK